MVAFAADRVTFEPGQTTAGVTFNDQGSASTLAQAPLGLSESFASTMTQPVASPPTDKRHCENGGWKVYGFFKNQGDCASYAATKPKNQPSG